MPLRPRAPCCIAGNEPSQQDQRRQPDCTALRRYIGALRFTNTALAECWCAAWAVYADRSPKWSPGRGQMSLAVGVRWACLPGIGQSTASAVTTGVVSAAQIRNIYTKSSRSNRVINVARFVPKCTQRPPRQALGGSGSLGVLAQPMWMT